METYTTAALSFRLTDVSLLVHLQIFCTILNEVASGNAAGWTDDWAMTRSASCRARDELYSTVATLSLSVTHRCNTVLCTYLQPPRGHVIITHLHTGRNRAPPQSRVRYVMCHILLLLQLLAVGLVIVEF